MIWFIGYFIVGLLFLVGMYRYTTELNELSRYCLTVKAIEIVAAWPVLLVVIVCFTKYGKK